MKKYKILKKKFKPKTQVEITELKNRRDLKTD